MPGPFELVVFDVGSVLVQCGRSWLEDATRAGFAVTEHDWKELEARIRHLPRRSIGAISNADYLPLFVEAAGGAYSLEDARRISLASLVAEYAGIGAVFDALEAASVATAVLSNVNDEEWGRMFPEPAREPEFPTLARTRHRFASHLMGFAKPDVRAYREVERVTGVAGELILFFDDRVENVHAARGCGWTAEVIDHTGDTAEQMLGLLRGYRVVE